MEQYTKGEKILYVFLILLTVFIVGVQVGIAQGKELQRQGYYDYNIPN